MADIEPDIISAWRECAKCFDERRDALDALSTTLNRQILVMKDIFNNGQQQIRSLLAYRSILSLAGVSQPRHTFEQWVHELDIKNADEIQRDWILISIYTAVKPTEDAYYLATRAYGQMQSILELQKLTWNSNIDLQADCDALLARLTQQRKETARIFEDDLRPLKALVDRVAGDLNNEKSRLPVSDVEEFKNATPQEKSMIIARQLKSEQADIARLARARSACYGVLQSALQDMQHQYAALAEIESELNLLQYGRAPQGQGGDWSCKTSGGSDTVMPSAAGTAPDNVPAFMEEYLPAPERLQQPGDEPGMKRCVVGRPVGKVLRVGERFYGIGRCDKHHDKDVFKDNMQIHRSNEGDYKLNEHAWKCTGQATRGPMRKPAHRL
ncbi:hypothetical protein C7974DRAFT_407641 [Boeremia exigua]|uniref:uncharacterized protein n=1 Tax=Boeremia exigua TaxID=749465 RepID=UPI001E8E24B1|nr:uncharacterized protein C7974DRAFT_407641 [Boeremia exigua]KAH6643932.1 hypothetical protein C7974DRAFT_407641 [Boeremia exigua]